MAGTFFNTGVVEFWDEMVNYSRNFENRSGSNVYQNNEINRKNMKNGFFTSLKGFLSFSR